jgi:DnaJ-class molecular chaperone
MTDYYALLEVGEKAGEDEIRSAYRRLAKKCHPDTHPGDAAAETRFKEIGEAYAVLGDAKKRKAYDAKRTGKATKRPAARETGRKTSVNIDKDGIDALFKDYFASAAPKEAARDAKSAGPIDANAAFEKFFGKR